MKIYEPHPWWVYPPRTKRLKWYAERLSYELLKKDQITQEDINRFWKEMEKIQKQKKFHWQKERLKQEAEECLKQVLADYQYDSQKKCYKKMRLKISTFKK
ncbi:hypothetical protein DRP05_12835 [Archaeoglobales archaeon]|nr:MAG: hypothetical protein DRP05_12835 [Archaeoglobales archaeon]